MKRQASQKYESLLKEYRKLAKRADQRLVRLEGYAHRTGFMGVLQFAYRKAQRNIRSWSGDKATRFNTRPPKNTNQLKAKIADIKNFLESATSTLKPTKTSAGVLSIYKKRVETINKKYGTNFTWQSFAKFMDSGINEKLDQNYDSEAKFDSIGEIQKNGDQIKEQMRKNEETYIQTEDDIVEFTANDMLSEYGLELLKLLI